MKCKLEQWGKKKKSQPEDRLSLFPDTLKSYQSRLSSRTQAIYNSSMSLHMQWRKSQDCNLTSEPKKIKESLSRRIFPGFRSHCGFRVCTEQAMPHRVQPQCRMHLSRKAGRQAGREDTKQWETYPTYLTYCPLWTVYFLVPLSGYCGHHNI